MAYGIAYFTRFLRHGVALAALVCAHHAAAQVSQIPGAADPGRIQIPTAPMPAFQALPKAPQAPVAVPNLLPYDDNAPEFILKSVNVIGSTVLASADVKKLFARYEMQTITTNTINELARDLTQYYHERGYAFSRVIVPVQEIDGGVVSLKVLEGYIGDVLVPPEMQTSSVLQDYIEALKQQKPLRAADLESFLLRINALPQQRAMGVLEPMHSADEAAMQLKLVAQEEAAQGVVAANNHGSRFLGPWQTLASLSGSLAPLHRTTLTLSSSLPMDEMNYGGLRHHWAFAPRWQAEFFAGYAHSKPGHTLAASDIESSSTDMGVRMVYQAVRQRDENWQFALQIDGRNTSGDTLGTALTRDKIRTARISSSYDWIDAWQGQTIIDTTVSQGVPVLGASDAGDANLSRAQAEPDFRKVEISIMRQQYLGRAWLATAQFLGQYASAPLFSAEEFGYGGINMGRAYDPSEMIGDHGAAASIMLAYTGLEPHPSLGVEPYVFYDIGRVWNEDNGSKPQSGASAGVGVRLIHASGFSTDMVLAQPLTKSVNDPITGNERNPRFLFETKKSF